MKILLTAPNLDEKPQCQRISTVVRQIIERGTFRLRTFHGGQSRRRSGDARWFLKQISLPFRFFEFKKRKIRRRARQHGFNRFRLA
jgi:hypothetical protein